MNRHARNRFLNLEDLTEEELAHLKRTFARIAESHPAKAPKLADTDKSPNHAVSWCPGLAIVLSR